MAWVGTAVLALGSGGPPSLVTGGPPAPGVWWWMILAPIFLGEPRLCTQPPIQHTFLANSSALTLRMAGPH